MAQCSKVKAAIGGVVVAAAGLVGCSSSQPVPDDVSRAEAYVFIDHALDDFHDAAAKSDFKRYFSHWTETSVFLGTDASERWVGEEFKAFARPYFDKGKGWKYVSRDRRIDVAPDHQHAWFDELLTNEKLGTCRGSGVLERRADGWKVMQYNLSIQVPNDLAENVAGQIRTFETKAK